jgi:hypothetical protein
MGYNAEHSIKDRTLMQQKKTPPQRVAHGFCRDCGEEHAFYEGEARDHCRELMRFLEQEERIDLHAGTGEDTSRLSTASLYGEARGKMFGVMICRTTDGSTRILQAFSGQYNGLWEVQGWAPPLFDVTAFNRIYTEIEPRIKDLGRAILLTEPHSTPWTELIHQRKQLSRQWMRDIHSLYTLTNFRGEERSLTDAFARNGGIPTGTGDCCAPKLFNQAVKEYLTPMGMAEFYWGRENSSQTRHHGQFYPSCANKCAPILGFILCGLEETLKKKADNTCRPW